ncbi:MAG: hypothetical protein IKG85_09705 [Clostridia bacterium]|nr:hypothetical protein [Clostridia bacterium]
MQTSRDPAKSRPLSANVKRLMRLARSAPENGNVIKVERTFTDRGTAYCHKQGLLFMEAASMGFSMEEFAPLYMTSQLAGVFDVSFAAANGIENDDLSNILRIPMLLKSPGAIVEALYWIDDIISRAEDGQNKSLLLSEAYGAEKPRLPPALAELPEESNRDVDELSYAYWLGY